MNADDLKRGLDMARQAKWVDGPSLPAALSVHLTIFRKSPTPIRYRQMPCERAESSAADAASQSGSPKTILVHPTPQGVEALSHQILHQPSWNWTTAKLARAGVDATTLNARAATAINLIILSSF
jgi:hypothetical protein